MATYNSLTVLNSSGLSTGLPYCSASAICICPCRVRSRAISGVVCEHWIAINSSADRCLEPTL
jgi:hypothetical protein